jgi:hypothetical protein
MRGTGYPDFFQQGRVFLDGKLFLGRNFDRESPSAGGEDVLKAGTKHTLAVEVNALGPIGGTTANCWLNFVPEPAKTIDITGKWATTQDLFLKDPGEATLPGNYVAKTLRRQVDVPKEYASKNLVLIIRSERMFNLFINNTYVPFNGGPNKGGNEINITPYLRFGEKNDIQLINVYERGNISYLGLHVYDKEQQYP